MGNFHKSIRKYLLIVLTTIFFIILDISSTLLVVIFSNFRDIFSFIALTLIPSITTNIFLSYSPLKLGHLPGDILVYR